MRAHPDLRSASQRSEFFELTPNLLGIAGFDGYLKDVNAAWEEVTGFSKPELQSRPLIEFVHEADQAATRDAIAAIARGLPVRGFTNRRLRKDGSYRWIQWNAVRAPDGKHFYLAGQDVTERREAERKYRELVELANSIILRWTRDGRITFLNEFGQRYFGYAAEEIVGRHVMDTIVPRTDSAGRDLSRLMDQVLADPAAFEQNVNENVRRDGQRVWIAWTNKIVRDAQDRIVEILSIGTDITQRRCAEEALRRSEAQLSLILNNVSDVVFAVAVEPDGSFRFASANRRFLDTTGLPEERVLGALVTEVIPPSARALVLERYREAIRSGLPVHWEEESDYPSGKKVGHVTVVPVFDARGTCTQLIGMVHDITERKQAERAIRELNTGLERRVTERTAELRAANAQLGAILAASDVGIMVVRDRVILQVNASGERIFAYGPGEMAGLSARAIYRDEAEYAQVGRHYEAVWRGETHKREQQLKRKDGRLFWARLTVRALDPNDRDKGIVAVIDDISAEKENAAALQRALEEAQSADRLKSAFLATMSHELRTPLNSIIGFSGILLQGLPGPLNAEQSKQLAMIKGSSDHLLSLINDILDLSKIEAGQFTIAHEPCDLRAAVHQAILTAQPLADKKRLDLEEDVPAGIGQVLADPRRLEQVLLNLLSNAIKFTETGRVRVECRRHQGRARIRVSDTGIGIKKEDLGELFKPFRQIQTGISRQYEGSGLGLSICKKLLGLMDGDIRVESVPGQGSTFSISLRGAEGRP